MLEDSTFVRFPKGNAEDFPGHGNASGATAGCKVDLAFDLLGGALIRNELHLGTETDNTIGADLVDELVANDLVLRDMGYFGVDNFRLIEALNAFWLSRLPLTADVVTVRGVALKKVLESWNHTAEIPSTSPSNSPPRVILPASSPSAPVGRRRRNAGGNTVPMPKRGAGPHPRKPRSVTVGI